MIKAIIISVSTTALILFGCSFAPLTSVPARSLKVMVISDLNSSYGSVTYSDEVKSVISRVAVIKPDIILCAGDMVAGQKVSLTDDNIRQMWSAFKTTVLEPVSRQNIPFGFTVGNHDASPSFTRERNFSSRFWRDESAATHLSFADSTHYPFYYSYVKQGVFFISWDAAGAEVKDEVYSWMKTQLNSKLARKATHRILLGHLPLYAIVDSKNKPGEVNSDPEKALRFFKENNLDLYISGHQHAYYPAEKQGISFLNMGCIGDGPRKLIGNDQPAGKSYTILDIPAKRGQPIRFEAFSPADVSPIPLSSLPDSVIGFNGVSYKTEIFGKDRKSSAVTKIR